MYIYNTYLYMYSAMIVGKNLFDNLTFPFLGKQIMLER